VSFERALCLVGLTDSDELGGEFEPLFGVLRPVDGPASGDQRVPERRRIVEATGRLQCLPAEGVTALAVRRAAKCRCQPGEEPDPQTIVASAE